MIPPLFSPSGTLYLSGMLHCHLRPLNCSSEGSHVALVQLSSYSLLTRALSRCFGVRTGRDGRCS